MRKVSVSTIMAFFLMISFTAFTTVFYGIALVTVFVHVIVLRLTDSIPFDKMLAVSSLCNNYP